MSMFRSRNTEQKRKAMERKYRGRNTKINPEEERKLPSKQYLEAKCLNRARIQALISVFVYASENPLTRVYTWGMACYGALGIPDILRPKQKDKLPMTSLHKPSRCGFAETKGVRDIACGYGFTVFALDSTKGPHIMGTGINKDGQIGRSHCGGSLGSLSKGSMKCNLVLRLLFVAFSWSMRVDVVR